MNDCSTRHIARAAWFVFILAVGWMATTVGGCDKLSCSREAGPAAPAEANRWVEQTRLADIVPNTADAVIFSPNLSSVREAATFASARLPISAVANAVDAWKSALGVDLLDDHGAAKLGLESSAPAVVFSDQGFWAFGGTIKTENVVDDLLQEAIARPDITSLHTDLGTLDVLRLAGDSRPPVFVIHDDHTLLVASQSTGQNRPGDPATGVPDQWRPDSSAGRFVDTPSYRRLFRKMARTGELVSVVRPAAWLADRSVGGHAGLLLERILGQLGPVGVSASAVAWDEAINLRIWMPGNHRAPTKVATLGQADGKLPRLAGLVEPGVLGVFRLSVSPRQLYDLLVSTMPAKPRRKIGQFWAHLTKDLRINAKRDVLDNLTGHAVVVGYGLDRKALQASSAPWYLDMVQLEATHEAVLLPIKRREPIEQVLNALTTVSKGKLTRQAVGDTLQYAWIEGGTLKWALVLSDQHVVYVDSSVGFDHAKRYERGVKPDSNDTARLPVSRLLDIDDSAGLYVDTANLTSIFAEAGDHRPPAWLEAFESVVITTQYDGSTGVTDLELKVAPAGRNLR